MISIVVLLLAAPQTGKLEAGRLEVSGDTWLATGGVKLRLGALELTAAEATGQPSPRCPDGRVSVTGPLRLDTVAGHPQQLTAESARLDLCLPDGPAHFERLRLQLPRLRLSAERASLSTLSTQPILEARGVEASACGCASPPWHVTAVRANVEAGRGAWAHWPVLWVGSIPVAAAPAWYVPLARRQTGFLLPRLGWHGDDGPYGSVPLFWALHQSVDLTLEPGWRQPQGATAGGRLRWAADDDEGGELNLRWISELGTILKGRGTLPLGPARLAVEGRVASAREMVAATEIGLEHRQLDHQRGRLSLSMGTAQLGVGARATVLQDLRYDDIETPPDRRVAMPLPELWVRWSLPEEALAPMTVTIDGRFARLVIEDASDRDRLDAVAQADATWWLGPVRLRPSAGTGMTYQATPGAQEPGDSQQLDGQVAAEASRRLDGHVAAEASVGLARAWSTWQHTLRGAVDARAADMSGSLASVLEPGDRNVASRSVGVVLSSRWMTASGIAHLDLRGGYEAEAPVAGREPIALRGYVQSTHLRLDAAVAEPADAWIAARLGADGGAHLSARWLRADLTELSPWLRTQGPARPLQLSFDSASLSDDQPMAIDTVSVDFALPLGRWWLGYGAWVDGFGGGSALDRLLGHSGHLRYAGRCDCWSANLWASHERGRSAPDVRLTVAVSL